jgi:hypothetical protein
MGRRRAALLLFVALLGAACARDGARRPRPLLVFGVDGGEWVAIERLWAQGRLPALRAVADRGQRAVLETFHGSSPVLWTTVATGLGPEEHGIQDFVVPTEDGDLPLSSTLRKAPALWNMLSSAGRRVAVFGYWASWPAETVSGVVVTDRALESALPQRVHPESFLAAFEESQRRALAENTFPVFDRGLRAGARDLAFAAAARQVAVERPLPDLLFAYFRSVDVTSHADWGEFAAGSDNAVARAYDAVDQAIAVIVAAAGGLDAVNVLVVSDHGFEVAPRPKNVVRLDFDRLLSRLGYSGRAVAIGSPRHRPTKRIHFLVDGEAAKLELARALRGDLETVRWANDQSALRWRAATAEEAKAGADAVAEVETESAALPLHIAAGAWAESRAAVDRVTGRHDAGTAGILLAAGPDIARGGALLGAGGRAPNVRDLAPTILYAVGLPYGRDFVGRPLAPLFTSDFRATHPLRAIDTWGRRTAGAALDSSADEQLLEELRALGYLD